MAVLERPVTKMNCSMPAACASSTAYWMSGLSTTGSISFGMALVAGRNRVPNPPTGKTALRTRCAIEISVSKGGYGNNGDPLLLVPSPRELRRCNPPTFIGSDYSRDGRNPPASSTVKQDFAGPVKLGGEICGTALIRVELHHEPAMRLANRRLARPRLEAQHGIGFLRGHRVGGTIGACPLLAHAGPGRGGRPPIPRQAVEIGLQKARRSLVLDPAIPP